jgi:pimeloyl-ACP methyl ester carboxylesterase
MWGAPLKPYREVVRAVRPERLVPIDGQRVHVTRSGRGRPLLLLHGLTASHYSFRRLAPLLEDGFEVITIDLNGFGLTERPRREEHYGLGHQAGLIARILDTLGIAECDVLAHSYGATVASTLAKQHAHRVGKLVFVSPASAFDPLPWYLHAAPGKELFYRLVRLVLSDPERYRRIAARAFHVEGAFTEADSEVYRSHLLVEGLRSAWYGFFRAMRDPAFPGSAYHDLDHPVLILAGELDEIVPLPKCEILVQRLPRARLEVIADCGHSAPEERPAEVAEAARRFLSTPGGVEAQFDRRPA